MIDGASEPVLKDKLGEFFRNRKFDKSKIAIHTAYLTDEDFQRIKVQFRALGLIATDDRQLTKEGAKKQWILTPYGDTVLTQVAAILSSKKPNKLEPPADSLAFEQQNRPVGAQELRDPNGFASQERRELSRREIALHDLNHLGRRAELQGESVQICVRSEDCVDSVCAGESPDLSVRRTY
jgi:hypothetical protein